MCLVSNCLAHRSSYSPPSYNNHSDYYIGLMMIMMRVWVNNLLNYIVNDHFNCEKIIVLCCCTTGMQEKERKNSALLTEWEMMKKDMNEPSSMLQFVDREL